MLWQVYDIGLNVKHLFPSRADATESETRRVRTENRVIYSGRFDLGHGLAGVLLVAPLTASMLGTLAVFATSKHILSLCSGTRRSRLASHVAADGTMPEFHAALPQRGHLRRKQV